MAAAPLKRGTATVSAGTVSSLCPALDVIKCIRSGPRWTAMTKSRKENDGGNNDVGPTGVLDR